MARSHYSGGPTAQALMLELPRPFDSSYQSDVDCYKRDMELILERLAVRATAETKAALTALKTRITNRGRAEAIALEDTVYVDIALLDLVSLLALEYGIAEVRSDDYHMLDFEVSYSVALSTDERLEAIDPFLHAQLTDKQARTLWADVLTCQKVFFQNTLAFVLAHEVGHIVLRHEEKLSRDFPSEQAREAARDSWNRLRQEMELEADGFASELTLNALFQPANMVPWFGLNEVRRVFYGVSAEYPSPGQREAAVRAAYERLQDSGRMANPEMSWPAPLAPHRDMRKVDKTEGLKRIREVRNFRREFLAATDEQLGQLLGAGAPVDEAVAAIVEIVETNRSVLQGSYKNQDAISEVLAILDSGEPVNETQSARIRALIEKACPDQKGLATILDLFDSKPVDWSQVKAMVQLMTKQRPELAMAIQWKYMLANTCFRWEAAVYQAYTHAVSAATDQQLAFEPYKAGMPLRHPAPANEDTIRVLQTWDGSYKIEQ